MNTNFSYYINTSRKCLCKPNTTTPVVSKNDLPELNFGDEPIFTFTFPDDVLTVGDYIVLAVDDDFKFYSETTTNEDPITMCFEKIQITSQHVTAKSLSITLRTRTKKFLEKVNGKSNSIKLNLGVYLKKIVLDATGEYITLARSNAFANAIIADYNDTSLVLPLNIYYTRKEISAIYNLMAADELSARNSAASAESYKNSAQNYSNLAAGSATSAANSAKSAEDSAEESKSWFNQMQATYRHINLAACSDMGIVFGSTSNQLMWTDPDNVVLNESSLADWEKTELWALESSSQWPEYPGYPGATLLATTQKNGEHPKNSFSSTPFTHSGLQEGHSYTYALFSYTSSGSFNCMAANRYPLSTTWNWPFLHQFSQAGTLLNYVSIGDLFLVRHDDFTHTDGTHYIPVRLMDYDGCLATDQAAYPHCAQFQFVDCLYSSELNYGTGAFDASESQYEFTEDTIAITGKTYYTKSGSTYTALVEGTDWNPGDPVPADAWYEKNKNPNYNGGTNIWKESNLRQYLNSNSPSGWWQKQNLWDKATYNTRKGFICSLEASLKPCLVPVSHDLALATCYGGGQYSVSDKIFIPSRYEVFENLNNGVAEGRRRWRWYEEHNTNADRIKMVNSTPSIWQLSSASTDSGNSVYHVTATGTGNNNGADSAYGLAPAFCI